MKTDVDKIAGIDDLTLKDLLGIYQWNTMPYKAGMSAMREFMASSGATYDEARSAFSISQKIFS